MSEPLDKDITFGVYEIKTESETIQFASNLFRIKYAILRDKSPREIIKFAKKNPEVYIFPFVTEKKPQYNYKKLKKHPKILPTVYIGNIADKENAIRTVIEKPFRDAVLPVRIEEVPYK